MSVAGAATGRPAGHRWTGPSWAAAFGLAAAAGAALLAGLALAGVLRPAVAARHGTALRGEATWAPGARPAPAFPGLRDQRGAAVSPATLHGRPVAVTFLDSHCHAACPLEGRAFAAAEAMLPAAARPVLVVVSVNPLDTPASARAAIRAWGLARLGPWHWLLGPRSALARAWRAYHIAVVPTRGDITHTEATYLVDRRGDERSAYLFPFAPRFVAHDLAMLARGAHRGV